MSKPLRWVLVGADTTPDIRYNGTWFSDHGSLDSIGYSGPPYFSTLRGTTTNGSSFTYSFSGSAFTITSSIIIQSGSTTHATCACFLDGKPIPYNNAPANQNNQPVCFVEAMVDGPHTVTVRAIVDVNQTFWLDRIQYLPSAGRSLTGTNITTMVLPSDTVPQYDSSWLQEADATRMATQYGAKMTLDFYGTSLTWFSHVPRGFTGRATTGAWSIDDNLAQNFTIPGYEVNENGVWNQNLFHTLVYPVGTHRLNVTYYGDGTTMPLGLHYIAIHNSSIDASSRPSLTGSTGSSATRSLATSNASASATNRPASSSTNTGARIGGAVGGAVILIVIIFILYRRRRQSRRELEWNESYGPPTTAAQPFFISSQIPWGRPVVAIPLDVDRHYPNQVPSARKANTRMELASGFGRPGTVPHSGVQVESSANVAGVAVGERRRIVRAPQDAEDGHVVDLPPEYTEES